LLSFSSCSTPPRPPPSLPTRRSSDLVHPRAARRAEDRGQVGHPHLAALPGAQGVRDVPEAVARGRGGLRLATRVVRRVPPGDRRSEEHTSELQSRENLVCRLLLEKKN